MPTTLIGYTVACWIVGTLTFSPPDLLRFAPNPEQPNPCLGAEWAAQSDTEMLFSFRGDRRSITIPPRLATGDISFAYLWGTPHAIIDQVPTSAAPWFPVTVR